VGGAAVAIECECHAGDCVSFVLGVVACMSCFFGGRRLGRHSRWLALCSSVAVTSTHVMLHVTLHVFIISPRRAPPRSAISVSRQRAPHAAAMSAQAWLTHCSDRAANVIIVSSELTAAPPAFQSLILSPAGTTSAAVLGAVPPHLEVVSKALLGQLASSSPACKSLALPCGLDRTGTHAESTFSVLTAAADEIHAAGATALPQLLLASSEADIQWAHACACAYAIRWLGVPATEAIRLSSALFEPTLLAHLTACALYPHTSAAKQPSTRDRVHAEPRRSTLHR